MVEPALRVLIADDDPRFLGALALALDGWHGIEVVATARDGAEAVQAFAASRPDLAIVDLAMPRGDGISVTTEILAIDPDATVLILSATETLSSLTRCLEAGACGCLRKGVELSMLPSIARALSGASPFVERPRRG